MSVGSLTVSLALDAVQYFDGMSKAEQASAKLEAASAKAAKAIDKQIAGFELAAASTGKSAREATLLALATDGATKAQLASADAALRQVEGYEKGVAIGNAFKASLVALGVAAVAAVAGFRELVDGAAKFADLSDATGASAESLASLAVSASVAGVSMDSIGSAVNKLSKGLTGVDDDSKAAGAALAAINLPIADFKKLDPVAQYLAVGQALDGFADGAAKVAVAQALFGKAGAEQLKVLKELNAEGGASVILTADQIARADDYGDAQARATAQLKLYAAAASTEILPAVTAFTGALKETVKGLLGVNDSAGGLPVSAIQEFAFKGATALGFLVDAVDGVGRAFELAGKTIASLAHTAISFGTLDFSAAKAGVEAYKEDIAKVLDAPLFSDKLQKSIDATKAALAAPVKLPPVLPAITFEGANKPGRGNAGADDTKKVIDAQLRAIEAGIKAEQDLAATRNRFLDLYNSQGLVSISDYYARRRNVADEALAAEIAGYDREIAALEAFQVKAKTARDKAAIGGQISALQDKSAEAQKKAGAAALLEDAQRIKTADDLSRAIAGVNAQVLEMNGNLSAAAAIKFDQSNAGLSKLFTANGNAEGATALAQLRAYTVARAEFDQQAKRAADVQDALKTAEDRVAISEQIGATTSLTALKQVGAARQDAVRQLEAIVAAEEAMAKASGSPVLVQQAEASRLALDKLAASANPLAEKFNGVFETSFGNAFAGFIDGSKSAGQAFQDFGRSVISTLANIAAQELAKSIFGSASSSAGGIGGLLGSLFGAGSAGSAATDTFGAYALGSFDVGTNYVTHDQVAKIHEGEAVVPKRYNPAAGGTGAGGSPITILNQTTGRIDRATEQRLSSGERQILIEETANAVAGQFANPNSKVSQGFSRGYKAERKR